jgi:hypothetical protein
MIKKHSFIRFDLSLKYKTCVKKKKEERIEIRRNSFILTIAANFDDNTEKIEERIRCYESDLLNTFSCLSVNVAI